MREGWTLAPLGNVTEQVIESINLLPDVEYRNLGVKWYAAGTFLRDAKPGRDIKASRLFRVRPGQFVYNRLFATEGSFALIGPEDAEAVASNEFPVFDVDATRLLPEYLYLHFQQESVWQEVNRQCTGTTKSRLRWKEERFRAFTVALPPLLEQRRIVDLIEVLDEAIACSRAAATTVDAVLARMRGNYPAVPDHVRISSIVTGIDGGKSVQTSGEAPLPGEPAILKLSAIQLGAFNAAEAKRLRDVSAFSHSHLVSEGDLLITRASGSLDRVGFLAIARDVPPNVYIPDLIWRIRLDETRCLPAFLCHLLASPEYRGQVTSTARGSASMRKINKQGFGELLIPLPSIEEQLAYVLQCDQAAAVKEANDDEAERLLNLREHLLPALLSGEHEIPESYDELMEVAS